MISNSSRYTCIICKRILKDPVILPCSDSICGEQVSDGIGSIKCLLCYIEISEDNHLNDEENKVEQSMQDLIQQLENLQTNADEKERVMRESTSFDYRQDIDSPN